MSQDIAPSRRFDRNAYTVYYSAKRSEGKTSREIRAGWAKLTEADKKPLQDEADRFNAARSGRYLSFRQNFRRHRLSRDYYHQDYYRTNT